MNQRIVLTVLGVCLLLLPGCRKGKPDGIPPLFPVTVKITKGDTPVTGANVFLVAPTSISGSWSASGVTDASGLATIETSQGDWKAKGAPEGEFKIYLTKLAKFEEPPPPSGDDDASKADFYAERLKRLEAAGKEIPKSLTTVATSELKISIVAGTGANETFDISKY